MGNWSSKKECSVIYVSDGPGRFYPVHWPYSLQEFKDHLRDLFPRMKLPSVLRFQDASLFEYVSVSNETSFQALVPRYHENGPEVKIYYVLFEIEWNEKGKFWLK